ncbi:Pectinesterase PPME1 [Morella rubra]|uniref:Pectinesterase n=1 Tax=Morella rubra TaxID=262757 RepID=A0A6A1US09_9ROSI|nr:Pectinesterase PPME1 [Morella rubra]
MGQSSLSQLQVHRVPRHLMCDTGRHLFKDCYIEGTVDFIFGNGKSVYMNTAIKSVAEGLGVITVQAMGGEPNSKFIFIHCNITGSGDMYLGRAWKETSRVVFAYTYMGPLINKTGWMRGALQKYGACAVHLYFHFSSFSSSEIVGIITNIDRMVN